MYLTKFRILGEGGTQLSIGSGWLITHLLADAQVANYETKPE